QLASAIEFLELRLRDGAKKAVPENFAYLVALGFVRDLDFQLKDAPLTRAGSTVKLTVAHKHAVSAQFVARWYSLVSSLGVNASRTFTSVSSTSGSMSARDTVETHLGELGLALERYHDKHGRYPPRCICDPDGRPLLSWRVALLPYLGEKALYDEFRLDEP